jgi:hypothetical protein
MSNLTICCDPISVFLFWLAMRAGRAIIDGRAAAGARKAAALAKGRRKRAFMVGYLEFAGQRAAAETQLGGIELARGELTHWTGFVGARRDER